MAKKKTTEQFKKEVYELRGPNYIVLGEYISAYKEISIKHNKCGKVFEVKPKWFLDESKDISCPHCLGTPEKVHLDFVKTVYELTGDKYTVLSQYCQYRHMKSIMLIRCNECGNNYQRKAFHFFEGRRCPICREPPNKKTQEQFEKEIYDLVKDEYTVLGKYKKTKEKIKIKHNKCGHIYKVKPCAFLNGSRCPKCNSSKGELLIISILEHYKIEYQEQYKFKDCKYKSYLPFDIAIFKNDELILLIEYDGEQHYRPVDYFGGNDNFENVKIRDNIKTQYCIDNNIPLLRIPYWEFDNINEIITKKLFELNLIL